MCNGANIVDDTLIKDGWLLSYVMLIQIFFGIQWYLFGNILIYLKNEVFV